MGFRYPLYLWVGLLCLSFCFSCTDMVPTRERRLIDSLNEEAYDYRYRDLDSSWHYAERAYNAVNFYHSGKAEAANHLGFLAYIRMDFDKAAGFHKEVYKLTKNDLELLIADVGMMKICQRTSMNKEFYDYRNTALKRMKRIREDNDLFTDRHESKRLTYALSEFGFVSATYYYYLQQRREARAAIEQVDVQKLASDTSQLLYYHYLKGAASLTERATPEERKLYDFDELQTTWALASRSNYPYFEANALQSIATLMSTPENWTFYHERRKHVLEGFGLPVDSLLPLRLAQQSLQQFRRYGDLYQIAGAYVSIGRYLNRQGRYAEALDTLTRALQCVNLQQAKFHNGNLQPSLPFAEADTTAQFGEEWLQREKGKAVPEWISRIREQLSVSYAGLGRKAASDYNRNIYLDILNYTRQDKELESRFQALEAESKQITWILIFVIVGFFLVVLFFLLINRRSKLRNLAEIERLQQILSLCKDITSSIPMNVEQVQKGIDRLFGENRMRLDADEEGKVRLMANHRTNRDEKAMLSVLEPYIEWASDNERMVSALSDERSRLEKQRYIYEQHIASHKRENLVKKSCLAIVNGIHPYIDRILNEVYKLKEEKFFGDVGIRRDKLSYIDELVTTINEYNDILALWIKMKQGTLSLNIETFELNGLFELLSKSRRSFELKRQTLIIEPTSALVKADHALTLFMLNTLAENARKYTPEGGKIRIYARSAEEYVEISVEDNGMGLSAEDVDRIIGEKVYDSSTIGLKDAVDPEELKGNKGSGFGLMNCKGIIEKYRKTNELFRVCVFNVESEPGKGSRFYFRLPVGLRKALGICLCFLFSATMFSCSNSASVSGRMQSIPWEAAEDTVFNELLDEASDYANAAYFANVDQKYAQALLYVDSAIVLLNEHYSQYARPGSSSRYMLLMDEGTPAEIQWWNDGFDSDYHVILDIRNEAAVAFLALRQWDAYSYNNAAFTDLYKLQSEDRTLENFCIELELSNTNKTVGILLCVLLLIASLIGYYLFYMRKRLHHRMHLEQVLEINRKVFAASQVNPQEGTEALQLEENTLKEIPQRIVDEAFLAVNELLTIDRMGIAVYNESTRRMEHASYPSQEMPEQVYRCFETGTYLSEQSWQALPLLVEVGDEHQCVGVLYLRRPEGTEQNTDRLLFELVARYVAIVVFNAVLKPATKYRDIEQAHEEAYRASWEDSLLHVQNMVLDNCLSTIKHETIYYPNKIKQIIARLRSAKELTEEEERESVETIAELISYYKGIFTILSACASRQLEEVTFRRTAIRVQSLWDAADKYFRKMKKARRMENLHLQIEPAALSVTGDANQLHFLFENLIDEALAVNEGGLIRLCARKEEEYVRFLFTDTRREKSVEELNQLFYPNLARMGAGEKGELRGTEYLVCKQIIREHDEFAGRRGCRINAEQEPGGGFTVYFTLPGR